MLSEGRREDRKLLLETEFTDCYSAVVGIFIKHTGINSRKESLLYLIYIICITQKFTHCKNNSLIFRLPMDFNGYVDVEEVWIFDSISFDIKMFTKAEII